MRFCIFDFETRSRADLRKVGSGEYAQHKSTRILCVAYRIADSKQGLAKVPTHSWSPFLDPKAPKDFLEAILDPDTMLVAHNALFEQMVTRYVLGRYVPDPELREALRNLSPERWVCTAALAGAMALPRKLEGVGAALALPIQKDMEGHRLMLKLCKPRKLTKKNRRPWHGTRKDLLRLIEYCVRDLDTEVLVYLALPPLPPFERKVWVLDQEINLRGIRLDRELVIKVLGMIEEEKKVLNRETEELTLGELVTTNQRDGVLAWLESEGVKLPNLQAKTVGDAIKSGKLSEDARRILEIRQAISKTSTAKYHAMERRSRTDSLIRDYLVYAAASTWRWGGAGIQPQNFPRGSIKNTWAAAEILREGDLEWVRMLLGDPMNAFASCLRAMIIPRDGREFFCADYAAIETHVLFWIAHHEEGLRALRAKRDLYKEMASVIYATPAEKIAKDSRERFIGKESVLGCGYQMSGPTFRKNCIKKGVEVTEEIADLAVKKYREKHWPVPKLWYALQRAAIAAVRNPGKAYSINRTKWFMRGKDLFCELPSGRALCYPGAVIRFEPNKWMKEREPKLYHWGINSYTKKWELASTYGGKLTENVVQAVARDLLAAALVRIRDAGFEIVLHVHDEILAEAPKGTRELAEFEELMSRAPAWAGDCPVRVEGWKGPRYRK